MSTTAFKKNFIGADCKVEDRSKFVEKLVAYEGKLYFSKLILNILSEDTKYLVLDLDNTIFKKINLGVRLGWELHAEKYYGIDFLESIEDKREDKWFVLDWQRPLLTLDYLFSGLKKYILPALRYFFLVKLGLRFGPTKKLIFLLWGENALYHFQHENRVDLMEVVSLFPYQQVKVVAKRLWDRYLDRQIIRSSDIEKIRVKSPGICILVSSASPKAVLDVAKDSLGVDDVFFTEEINGEILANSSYEKVKKLVASYPDIFSTDVDSIGVSDTSYGEDYPWLEYFTKVVDVNSPDPFPIITSSSSPLKEVHSARMLKLEEDIKSDSIKSKVYLKDELASLFSSEKNRIEYLARNYSYSNACSSAEENTILGKLRRHLSKALLRYQITKILKQSRKMLD